MNFTPRCFTGATVEASATWKSARPSLHSNDRDAISNRRGRPKKVLALQTLEELRDHRACVKGATHFDVSQWRYRQIKAGERLRADDYFDDVEKEYNDSYINWKAISSAMDVITGVYTIPLSGLYEFDFGVRVVGKSAVVCLYLCRSDRTREMLQYSGVGITGCWKSSWVTWYCTKGDTVWLEVEAGESCVDDTKLLAGFGGYLRG